MQKYFYPLVENPYRKKDIDEGIKVLKSRRLTTGLLTAFFCYLFVSRPIQKGNFFSKWFHMVGYTSVIYDIILLVFIYIIYLYLEHKN